MKKKQRIGYVIIATCVFLAFGMTACGTKQQETDNSSKATATSTAPKQVTLKIMHSGPGQQPDTAKVIEEFNNQLSKVLPNTKVDMDIILATQYEEKLRLVLAAGESVDVANLTSGTGEAKNDLVTESKKGTMRQLDDLLKSTPKLTSTIPEAAWARGKVEGKTYMVPINGSLADKCIGIKMQKELTDKYLDINKLKATLENDNGVVKKETYDILTDYLKTLKDNGQIRRGASVETMSWLPQKAYYSLYNWGFVIKKDDKNCKVLNYFEQPDVKMMFDVHADWFKKGYVEKDILSMQNRRQYEKKLDGNVLFMTTQQLADTAFPELDSDKTDTNAYGYPVATVSWAKNYYIVPPTNSVQGLIIPKTSKNPDRAIQYLEVINTNYDLYELFSSGIEGVHFTRNDKGIPQAIVKAADQQRYGGYGFNFGNSLLTSPKVTDSYNSFINQVMNGKAISTPLVAFRLNIDPIKTEAAQFDAVRKEFELSLNSGAAPNHEEIYKQMIAKMKAAGADKIQAEIQKQVDDYLKANPVK